MYTSACIEEAIIGKALSKSNSNDSSHGHSWDYEDYAFDYLSDKYGVDKLFQTTEEVITRELKVYIIDWGGLNIKNKIQLSCTMSQNMAVWVFMMKILKKYSSLLMKNFNLRKMMARI